MNKEDADSKQNNEENVSKMTSMETNELKDELAKVRLNIQRLQEIEKKILGRLMGRING